MPRSSTTPSAAATESGEEVEFVAVNALRTADSPRLAGVDVQHVRMLIEASCELPPILVQRRTLRVIDGMHRLRAAQMTRRTHIRACLCDDDDDDAFLRSVAANVTHGLPLTLSDRRTAALRIMHMKPDWSDRAIGEAAGLSGKTVAALRRAELAAVPASGVRLGRDGRRRPLDASAGRRVASEMLTESPHASLRQVAAAAGISPSTVRDVRDRLRSGRDPVITGSESRGVDAEVSRLRTCSSTVEQDPQLILDNLSRDPSLRYTDSGRRALNLLRSNPLLSTNLTALSLPPHCLPVVAQLARAFARQWARQADELENWMRESIAESV